MLQARLLAALPAAFALNACVIVVDGDGSDGNYRGSFDAESKRPAPPADAEVRAFDELHAASGATVRLRPGATYRVVLDERAVETGNYDVDDGVLKVECRKPCRNGMRGEAVVYAPTVSALQASSGADLIVEDGFDSVASLSLRASSGADLDARRLAASEVTAQASSGGAIRLTALDTLDGSASSGGDVRYWGQPRVDASESSGGDVRRGD
ncbi:GIN domain-containing protein [Parvularcula dongshanensis]|uniref:Putative auto-transporter adhesin head GIN domain-containing protein n=1 Tax=Parvularcula dongshanensis TaxID=1173995 RepID=A0A840I2Y0_9PROT|nr:DUF2807 domain-containing protein [Parvularcula dongshanensis]MBB4659366.1 hypothetical protein [Parvularcula dongshanensis]